MKAQAGQLLVLAALAGAGFSAVAGLTGALRGRVALKRAVRAAALGAAVCVALASAVLWWALFAHDFSVRYVAKVGSRDAPAAVTFSAFWSAFEGSLLFWALLLALLVLAFLFFERRADARLQLAVLGTSSAVGAFFLAMLAGPASPFRVLAVAPADGQGVAPLLQDHVLMLVHPPTLYGGQAGLALPFGVALLALAHGKLEPAWRAVLRRWLLVAWVLLTAGVLLGAWWAYAVLGWGGYWAWDPVENASLLPWLFATALLHVLRAVERRAGLEPLALWLAVGAFALTLFGIYATRSGNVSSVHAFASSPTGPLFLAAPVAAVLGSVALWVLGARRRAPAAPLAWGPSREVALVLGASLLALFAAVVLLALAWPLLALAFDGRKVAVARPYFDGLAVPFALATLFLMGVAPALPWGEAGWKGWSRRLLWPLAAAALTAVACALLGVRHAGAVATFALAAFAAAATVPALPWSSGARGLWRERRQAGAWLCHLGVLVALVAIAASSALGAHVEVAASPGESFAVGRHRVRYLGLVTHEEPHRRWVAAAMEVVGPDGAVHAFDVQGGPRLTFYPRREQPVSKPLVHSEVGGDVYVTLGGFEPETRHAGFAAWEFPLVSWLWASLPLMLLGALLAASAGVRGLPCRRGASSHRAASSPPG